MMIQSLSAFSVLVTRQKTNQDVMHTQIIKIIEARGGVVLLIDHVVKFLSFNFVSGKRNYLNL